MAYICIHVLFTKDTINIHPKMLSTEDSIHMHPCPVYGNMPIHIACLCGHLNVVKYLITEMKCNPKSTGTKV